MSILLSYNDFISGINSYKISRFEFGIADYSHYKNCQIFLKKTTTPNDKIIFLVSVQLTLDKTEFFSFYKKIREDYKLFYFGRNSERKTLKQVWDKIIIKKIVYSHDFEETAE